MEEHEDIGDVPLGLILEQINDVRRNRKLEDPIVVTQGTKTRHFSQYAEAIQESEGDYESTYNSIINERDTIMSRLKIINENLKIKSDEILETIQNVKNMEESLYDEKIKQLQHEKTKLTKEFNTLSRKLDTLAIKLVTNSERFNVGLVEAIEKSKKLEEEILAQEEEETKFRLSETCACLKKKIDQSKQEKLKYSFGDGKGWPKWIKNKHSSEYREKKSAKKYAQVRQDDSIQWSPRNDEILNEVASMKQAIAELNLSIMKLNSQTNAKRTSSTSRRNGTTAPQNTEALSKAKEALQKQITFFNSMIERPDVKEVIQVIKANINKLEEKVERLLENTPTDNETINEAPRLRLDIALQELNSWIYKLNLTKLHGDEEKMKFSSSIFSDKLHQWFGKKTPEEEKHIQERKEIEKEIDETRHRYQEESRLLRSKIQLAKIEIEQMRHDGVDTKKAEKEMLEWRRRLAILDEELISKADR